MSVLVRGMKMPETCDKCDFCIWSNYRQTAWCRREQRQCFDDYSIEYREKRAEFCPMSELPPHGRLIDADVLSERLESGENNSLGQAHAYYRFAKEWVKEAPTVIEADKEGEG